MGTGDWRLSSVVHDWNQELAIQEELRSKKLRGVDAEHNHLTPPKTNTAMENHDFW